MTRWKFPGLLCDHWLAVSFLGFYVYLTRYRTLGSLLWIGTLSLPRVPILSRARSRVFGLLGLMGSLVEYGFLIGAGSLFSFGSLTKLGSLVLHGFLITMARCPFLGS